MGKNILSLVVALTTLCAFHHAGAQVSFGSSELFNGGWKFTLSDQPSVLYADVDDVPWQDVMLPHDWSVLQPMSKDKYSCTGWLPGGIGWYRKDFSLVPEKGKRYYVYFEGVYNRSTVYLNGTPVCERPNDYVSFMCEITDHLTQNDRNVLMVKVDHSREADSRWYTGSGIYRNVWLVSAPESHLSQWGLGYSLSSLRDGGAVLSVYDSVDGETMKGDRVRFSLYDADSRVVVSKTVPVKGAKVETDIIVSDPKLWNLDSPYLYLLKADLLRKGRVKDSATTRVGIRDCGFDPDKGFFLNGRNMKLKGVCLHHDAGSLGSAVPSEVLRRRLENLKKIGVNAVRTSHNPQAPMFYDLCDEIGLLVMDEAFDEWKYPKRKWLEGWNIGTPGYQGSYDFFDEWAERDVRDMVRRDKNHPSVIMWSIGNEVDYPNDPYSHPVLDGSSISQPMYGGYHKVAPDASELGDIAVRLASVVRNEDASRPVTAALAGVVMSNETRYPEALDIVGYNYTEDRYDTDHKRYPARVIFGSENRLDTDAWKAVLDREFISGQFLWTGTDYLGESGAWPARGFHTGLLDFCGFPKPAGKFRASMWAERPVAFLGTSLGQDVFTPVWNYEDGQMIKVDCYTNQTCTRLLLNGKEVGSIKSKSDVAEAISWDIPYEKGKLVVQAIDAAGKTVAVDSLTSFGVPYALRAYYDDPKTEAVSDLDVRQIVVEVIDMDGNIVPVADNMIFCSVDGGGRLLGLESGNNFDVSEQYDNKCKAFNGRLLAYIDKGTGGVVTVQFTSNELIAAELILN